MIGPIAVGWLKDTTGSFGSGLYFLAACGLISAIMTLIAVHERYMPAKAKVAMAPT